MKSMNFKTDNTHTGISGFRKYIVLQPNLAKSRIVTICFTVVTITFKSQKQWILFGREQRKYSMLIELCGF